MNVKYKEILLYKEMANITINLTRDSIVINNVFLMIITKCVWLNKKSDTCSNHSYNAGGIRCSLTSMHPNLLSLQDYVWSHSVLICSTELCRWDTIDKYQQAILDCWMVCLKINGVYTIQEITNFVNCLPTLSHTVHHNNKTTFLKFIWHART